MLSGKHRLKKKNDFGLVFKKGKGFKKDFLLLKVIKNRLRETRFGFIVSSKVSKKAVVRNRIKRKLRGAVEKNLNKIEKGIDVVFVALPGLEKKKFREIEDIIKSIFKKSKII